MKQSISSEWLKMRHSKIVLVLAILPIISLIIGTGNFYLNQGILQNNWYSLWSQVGLFYAQFFLPILIAICCAYVCRLEHVNQNWNTVISSPVSIASVYMAKFIVVSILIFFAQAVFVGLYWFIGTLFSFSEPLPIEILGWTVQGWFASLSIIALQLELSIRMRSFATPIGISLCAVFLGLGLYVANLGLFFPFSLLTMGMSVLSQDSLIGIQSILFWVMSIVFILVFSTMAIRRLKNKDIISS